MLGNINLLYAISVHQRVMQSDHIYNRKSKRWPVPCTVRYFGVMPLGALAEKRRRRKGRESIRCWTFLDEGVMRE